MCNWRAIGTDRVATDIRISSKWWSPVVPMDTGMGKYVNCIIPALRALKRRANIGLGCGLLDILTFI